MNFQDLYDIFDDVDNEPYPKIEDVKQDYKLGKRLYNSYSGTHGELSAISQYVYEDITNRENNNLKKVLLRIAIDEMKHFKILGELLVELGFIPYFMGSVNNKWCSDNVKYKFNSIKDMLNYNIKTEKEAIKEYKKLIEMAENKCVQSILERIVKDEEKHIRIFKALLLEK